MMLMQPQGNQVTRNQCRTISDIRTSNDRRHLPALKPSVVITALNAVAVTALPVALRAPALGTAQDQSQGTNSHSVGILLPLCLCVF